LGPPDYIEGIIVKNGFEYFKTFLFSCYG